MSAIPANASIVRDPSGDLWRRNPDDGLWSCTRPNEPRYHNWTAERLWDYYDGRLTVIETAVRTWPKLEGPPGDLQVIEVEGLPGVWQRSAVGTYWQSGLERLTWSQLRARGTVREVQT